VPFDLKKEHVILTVGGIIASAAIAYLIYRAEKQNSDANAQQIISAEETASSQQQTYALSVPAISSVTTATSAGDVSTASSNNGASAVDPTLEAIIAAFQSNENTVQSQSTPIGQLVALPMPTLVNILPDYGNTFSPATTSSPTQPIAHPIGGSASLAV
jgi:hypothetical protein